MSGKHITQPRDRKSKRYRETHEQLKREMFYDDEETAAEYLWWWIEMNRRVGVYHA